MYRFFKLFGVRTVLWLMPIYWLVLATATHYPRVRLPRVENADKIAHFLAYAALAFLVAWAFPSGWKPMRNLYMAFLFVASYGAIDELTQPYFNRHADWYDWLADLAGAFFGVVAYGLSRSLFRRIRFRSSKRNEVQIDQPIDTTLTRSRASLPQRQVSEEHQTV